MKKALITLLCAFILMFKSFAEEGMWLPMLLGEQVYNDMVKKGLKLTKEQLYSINKASIKDAVIIFGGGCTGEIVSAEGLLFTNHHCGYDVIAAASSVDHNYLKNGFYAKNKGEEFPAETATYARSICIKTYPVREYLGVVFGYGGGQQKHSARISRLEQRQHREHEQLHRDHAHEHATERGAHGWIFFGAARSGSRPALSKFTKRRGPPSTPPGICRKSASDVNT